LKANLFALGALFFYTIFNLVFARRLAMLTPIVAVSVYTLVMASVSISVGMSQWKSLVLPNGEQYIWLILCGLCILFADICYVSALNNKGSLANITIVLSLLPVAVAAANSVLTQTMPSRTQVVAMFMAVTAVILVVNE
jgi:drug/metabolite transporter (DMT)-like permease